MVVFETEEAFVAPADIIPFPNCHTAPRQSGDSVLEHLLDHITGYARQVGLPIRLRKSFSAIAQYRDIGAALDGFDAIAAVVALEAGFRVIQRHLMLPPRGDLLPQLNRYLAHCK
jgi:hypothetical protein